MIVLALLTEATVKLTLHMSATLNKALTTLKACHELFS